MPTPPSSKGTHEGVERTLIVELLRHTPQKLPPAETAWASHAGELCCMGLGKSGYLLAQGIKSAAAPTFNERDL